MSYHIQVKVINNSSISTINLKYLIENKTKGTSEQNGLDRNGCSKIHPCDQYDLVYFWIIINNSKYKYFRVYPQIENKYIQRMILEKTAGNPSSSGHIKKVPVLHNGRRKITDNELKLAKSIFGNSLNYSKVYVHDSGWFPFGLQSKSTAVTPNGEIYFTKADYLADFALPKTGSKTWINDAHWFIHEMVHVWQFQIGFSVKTQGVVDLKNEVKTLGSHDAYEYDLSGKSDLNEFIMEAQADLLADYCMYINGLHKGLSGGWATRVNDELKYFGNKRYNLVLKRFLINPADKTLLPKIIDIVDDPKAESDLSQYFTYM